MKKPIILVLPILALLLSCQKSFESQNNSTNSPALIDDTSTILKIIEYQYSGFNIVDSVVKTLKNATLNGVKKITLREVLQNSIPVEIFSTQFSYDANNKLTEIKATNNLYPNDYATDKIFWDGDNVSKIVQDSTGIVKVVYNFTHTPTGANTLVKYTRTPRSNSDTAYLSPGNIFSITQGFSEFYVNGNYKPLFSKLYIKQYYNDCNCGSITFNGHRWDTITNTFNINTTNNLVSIKKIQTSSDTNLIRLTMPLRYIKDSIQENYVRSMNDNNTFSNLRKGLFGDKLFTLLSFIDDGFISNDFLLPETFYYNNFIFNTQTLKEQNSNESRWINGVPDPGNGTNNYVNYNYINTFDSQNRLIKSIYADISMPTTQYYQGFKIIWP